MTSIPRYIVATKPSAVKGGKVWEVFDTVEKRAVETWAHRRTAYDLCRRLNDKARAALGEA